MTMAELIDTRVDIGSTQLRLRYAGQGAPVAVLESDLGEGAEMRWSLTLSAAWLKWCAEMIKRDETQRPSIM